jgi:hypothetical protein
MCFPKAGKIFSWQKISAADRWIDFYFFSSKKSSRGEDSATGQCGASFQQTRTNLCSTSGDAQACVYYFEDELRQRSAAKLLTKDEAQRIACDDGDSTKDKWAEHRGGPLGGIKIAIRGSHALRFRFLGFPLCHDASPSGLMRLTVKNNRVLSMNET